MQRKKTHFSLLASSSSNLLFIRKNSPYLVIVYAFAVVVLIFFFFFFYRGCRLSSNWMKTEKNWKNSITSAWKWYFESYWNVWTFVKWSFFLLAIECIDEPNARMYTDPNWCTMHIAHWSRYSISRLWIKDSCFLRLEQECNRDLM